MDTPAEKRDWRRMRAMFTTVAPRYDFITRAFSYGMDRRWKRLGVDEAGLPARPAVLDLASGTGDFSRLVNECFPGTRACAVDLTEKMLRLARERGLHDTACADAASLPFADGCFDAVLIGYGLRNFGRLDDALAEIKRVLRPGGVLVTLDFFLPGNGIFRSLYLGYLYAQGAFWGTLLHGQPRVYTYIPDSLRDFLSIEEYSGLLCRRGWRKVRSRGYILGGIGLHWAAKEH